jgi:prepilin-type N-terminal cleavage/methylation domain-containing protein
VNRQRQAFSLVEILVTISLMTVLAAISIGNGKSLSSSRQPMAAAQMLEAELKKARALAINQEIPVAVCFSGGSSSGLTQSFYRLQGERPTGPTSSHQFSGELPEAYLCLGYWATASGSAVRAGIPNLCTVADSRNWSTLVNPVSSNDPMIVFAPNGNAYSNGLAYFNGAYHILACNGAECSAAGPPSGATGSLSYFSVNRVSHPQTVAISLAGQVWIEPGITDASSVATVEGHIKTASAAAPAPASTSAQAPVIVSTKAEPIPPGQTQALLYPQDHLVLQAEATSPDGSPLKCHWESANGKFSSGVPTDMVYDPVSQTYRSQWEWRPDPTAAATSYTLSCVVESAKGGVSASGASANLGLAVQARNNQYCYFRDYLNPSGVFQSHVSRVRVNGTGERLIHAFTPFDREYITSPAVPSSVLNKLAITTLDDTGGGSIYVCNADGTDFRKVCTRTYAPGNSPSIFGTIAPNIDFMEPVWAPDKKSLVYLDYNPSGFYDLKLVDFRVPNPTPVTLVNGSAAGDPFYPQFTADSDRLVYLRGSYKSWSTIASSNVYRAETCAWKQPGYPTKVLYSNPPNAGIHWGRANLKMMPN